MTLINGDKMKSYSLDKAKEIINPLIENITKAYLGMSEDWNWTAGTIFEDGKFTRGIESITTDHISIAGIDGSDWATPTLMIEFKDGTIKNYDCFTGDSDIEYPAERMTIVNKMFGEKEEYNEKN